MNKIKVKIELRQLQLKGGYYFFNDVLFAGEAYDHRDNQLYQIYEIEQGQIISSKEYDIFGQSGMLKLDYDLLDSKYDYRQGDMCHYYQNKLFTGVYYGYCNGFLFYQGLCIDGWVVKSITYFPDGTGRIKKYTQNEIDYTEIAGDRTWILEWDNNHLKKIESKYFDYQQKKSSRFNVYFNEQEQIKSAIVSNVTDEVKILIPRNDLGLDFKSYDDLLTKKNIIADNITIRYINDNYLNQWIGLGILDRVKHLTLCLPEINLFTIERLGKLSSLETLEYLEESVDETDKIEFERQKQQYRMLALALFSLQQNNNIKVTFNDGNVDYFQQFLSYDNTRQLS